MNKPRASLPSWLHRPGHGHGVSRIAFARLPGNKIVRRRQFIRVGAFGDWVLTWGADSKTPMFGLG